MTLTITYEPELSRVVIQGTDLPNGFVRVERSINEILWDTVRGGTAVEVEGGSFIIYDYEFFDGVENFYRLAEAINQELTQPTDNQQDGESWQVPIGVNELAFEMWGGGGGGQGYSPQDAANSARPGGGGGAYSASTIPVSSGETLTIRVGEGGSPSSQLNENDGASSFVKRGNSVLIEALAGTGSAQFNIAGTGGDANFGVGTVRFSGGDGGARQTDSTAGGGGGASATDSANGTDGSPGALGIGGAGGVGQGNGGAGGSQPPGLRMPGGAGNYASTPHDPTLAVTGDLDVRAFITTEDFSSGTQTGIAGKWTLTGNQRSWLFALGTDGHLQLYTSTDGTSGTQVLTSSSNPITLSYGSLAVRATLDADNGAAGRTITFYTADAAPDALDVGPWDTLGTAQIVAGTITLFNATLAPLELGSWNTGANNNMANGIYHHFQLRNGISGTTVANPVFYDQATDSANFVDSAGLTWTNHGTTRLINEPTSGQDGIEPGGGGGGQGNQQIFNPNTAASGDGAVGQLNIRSWPGAESAEGTEGSIIPDLEGNVWLKSIKYPFLNRIIECTPYEQIQRPFRGAVFEIQGRSMPIAVTDLRGSRRFTLSTITRTLEEARDLDLTLAANPLFFLHVPREDPTDCERVSAVPGGYVIIQDTVQRRALPGSQIYAWELPFVEVAKPDAQIVGTTLIWATVLNLYGSWEALLASNPAWLELFQQVGSPEDLVVL